MKDNSSPTEARRQQFPPSAMPALSFPPSAHPEPVEGACPEALTKEVCPELDEGGHPGAASRTRRHAESLPRT